MSEKKVIKATIERPAPTDIRGLSRALVSMGIANGELIRKLRNYTEARENIRRAIERRERELIPADGWPGKNEEARRLARAAALEANKEYTEMTGAERGTDVVISDLRATLEANEAERRGYEMALRAELALLAAARPVTDDESAS